LELDATSGSSSLDRQLRGGEVGDRCQQSTRIHWYRNVCSLLAGSKHILSLLTLTKAFLLKISEMLWEQLQDKLVCIAGVLLTMFLLGYLLHLCCAHAVDNGYRTLVNVQDDLGIDELFKVRLVG